jgi:hypothetical protein
MHGFPNLSGSRGRVVLVNGVLALGLLIAMGARQAGAQNAPARARGEYTMVSGRSNSGGSELVYVLDAANQEIVALKWDQSRQAMSAVGYRAMGPDGRDATPGR